MVLQLLTSALVGAVSAVGIYRSIEKQSQQKSVETKEFAPWTVKWEKKETITTETETDENRNRNCPDSLEEVLDLVKAYIKERVSYTSYACWVEPIKLHGRENDVFILSVPHNFQRKILLEQYIDKLLEGFKEVLGYSVKIDIIALQSEPPVDENKPSQ